MWVFKVQKKERPLVYTDKGALGGGKVLVDIYRILIALIRCRALVLACWSIWAWRVYRVLPVIRRSK